MLLNVQIDLDMEWLLLPILNQLKSFYEKYFYITLWRARQWDGDHWPPNLTLELFISISSNVTLGNIDDSLKIRPSTEK